MLTVQRNSSQGLVLSAAAPFQIHTPRFAAQPPDRFEKSQAADFELALEEQYKGSVKALAEAAARPENILGTGSRARVYRIPAMPGFCPAFQKRYGC
jgi:hypothetical protein